MLFSWLAGESWMVLRDPMSDKARAVIGLLFPKVKPTGRPSAARRTVVEAAAWRFRTGAPWRGVPERFGSWNTNCKNLGETPVFDLGPNAKPLIRRLCTIHERR
jgi:transposase